MADLCKHCGKSESEHHAFEVRAIPAGCVCADGWPVGDVPAICDSFESWTTARWCINCEHDRACHAPKD